MYKLDKADKNSPRYRISKNLRKLRGSMSRGLLSQKAKLSVNTIVKIETDPNSNPTIEALVRVSSALGIKVEELFR